jgi:hypothetical protein
VNIFLSEKLHDIDISQTSSREKDRNSENFKIEKASIKILFNFFRDIFWRDRGRNLIHDSIVWMTEQGLNSVT